MVSIKTDTATAVKEGGRVVNSAEQPVSSELTPAPKQKGKLRDTVSTISTVLPIAGAIGTMGVWLAATFYVADIQIEPDRAFNTLEVRVSDKKGQESVYHSPHFQLMPGRYHLEVTVDSQFKQHVDVKAVFHHKSTIPVHVPGVAINTAAGASSAPGALGAVITSGNAQSLFAPEPSVKSIERRPGQESRSAAGATTNGSASVATEPSADAQETQGLPVKKHWWQIWKKNLSQD